LESRIDASPFEGDDTGAECGVVQQRYGGTTVGAAINRGSTKSFTAPFSGDAALYIVDAAGHN
jgi:hypothetical protein